MSGWSGWGTRINVTSIVSQGLEQVSKLREDVEKQFDQVVTSAQAGKTRTGERNADDESSDELIKTTTAANGVVTPPRSSDGRTESTGATPAWVTQGVVAPPLSAPPVMRSTSASEKLEAIKALAERTRREIELGTAVLEEEKAPIADVATAHPDTETQREEEEEEEKTDVMEPVETSHNEEAPVNDDEEDNGDDAVVEEEESRKATVDGETVVEDEDEYQEDKQENDEKTEAEASSDDAPKESSTSDHREASATDARVAQLQRQLEQRETQLLSTSSVIQELHDELDKACEREVSAVERNRFLTEQIELMRQEVLKLNRIVAQQQQSQSRDSEVQALQTAILEKDEKLKALLDEGQALSIKQAQLEQRLRQLRKEKNEEEEQRLKLETQCETMSTQVQELTTKSKTLEDEKKRVMQEMRVLQQALDQTRAQFVKTDQELTTAQEVIESTRTQVRALADENEGLRDEIEQLQQRTESHATLSVERNEMDTTIQFLQHSLSDLERDSARREEMARVEITDLKRKWQDALHRVDALGHSVSEATQPLLRQIHALQEEQRGRQETWKATEATLLARLQTASQQRKEIEDGRLELEAQVHNLRAQIDDVKLEVGRKGAELARSKENIERLHQKEREARSQTDALHIEVEELKMRLQDELRERDALTARMQREGSQRESAANQDLSRQTATLTEELEALRKREQTLRHDLEWHQNELQRLRGAGLASTATSSPRPTLPQRHSFDSDFLLGSSSPRSDASELSQASILQRTLDSGADDSRVQNTSVLGLSQLQQRLRLRDGETKLLRQQLQTLEEKQKQSTDEIIRLSTRNALLETNATQWQQTQDELVELQQRQHVLLELFGEKEEQVEELQAEVAELKAFYKKQLDTLARQQAT